MKKFLVLFLVCVLNLSAYCEYGPVVVRYPLTLQVCINPVGSGNQFPKSPIEQPDVSISGHILFFEDVAYDLTLCLVDENDDVVYTVFVPAGTTSVVLPSTFTGSFELQLFPGGLYYFVSDIML